MIIETNDFTKNMHRMCQCISCDECNLKDSNMCDLLLSGTAFTNFVKGVYQWNIDHPVKSNFDKFKEVFGYTADIPPMEYAPFWSNVYEGNDE